MRWSWKLGRFAGIDVYVHMTFVLLIAWVAVSYWIQERSVGAALAGTAFLLGLFACVLLHEFGHALTAKRYGIRTADITLLPIGGLARLERIPDDPKQEFWVALAGPAVNVGIAAALFGWLAATAGPPDLARVSFQSGSMAERLLVANIVLVAFNLIPAFPMDGGRVLRALLATKLEYTRATHIAAGLGQAMAFLFGFVGLFSNPFLLFIALFVWIGAGQEASAVDLRFALGGVPVRRAMLTEFHTLRPEDPLSRAVELILSGFQQDFPVVEGERVVGVLTRSDVLGALAQQGPGAAVADVMQREFQTADSSDMLEPVFSRLQDCKCRTVPVVRGDRLVGMLTLENIGELLMVQAALGRVPGQRSVWSALAGRQG